MHSASSMRARVGDPLDFIVENDVRVGGSTIIRAKSPARGTVISVKGKRCLGIGGEVAYKLDSVALVNGEMVGLRGGGQVKGSYHIYRMVAGMAVTSLFYLPAGARVPAHARRQQHFAEGHRNYSADRG